MLPNYLRDRAKLVSKSRGKINLAVFGPGKTSPFFEKRQQVYDVIKMEHSETVVDFYLIDDVEPPTKDFGDYLVRVHPAEMKQIKWADIILFLLTHHQLTAFVEFGFLHSRDGEAHSPFDKCGLAISDTIQVSRMWFHEAQRLFNGNSDRLMYFREDELKSCHVATDIALELFERIVLERWDKI